MERMGMKPPSGTTHGLTGLPTPHRRRGLGDQSSVTADNESQLRNIIAKVLSSDSGDLLKVLTEVNHTLSTRAYPVIEPFVAADGVKAIIKKLTEPQTCAIYLEAVRALSNVACGTSEQAKAIVNSRGVEAICNLLRMKSGERPELCEQCLQALANVAGQNSTLRDTLLDFELIDLLGDLYQEVQHFSWLPYFSTQVVRSLTWLMSNLCQSQPAPPISKIVGAFDFFAEILNSCDDMQTINEACMGLSHFFGASDSEEEQLDFIREMLASWEVTGEDLQQRWNQIPGVARAKRCAKRLQEAGAPTPDRFLRLLNTARGWMPNELAPVDEEHVQEWDLQTRTPSTSSQQSIQFGRSRNTSIATAAFSTRANSSYCPPEILDQDFPCGETAIPPMELDEKAVAAGGYNNLPTIGTHESERLARNVSFSDQPTRVNDEKVGRDAEWTPQLSEKELDVQPLGSSSTVASIEDLAVVKLGEVPREQQAILLKTLEGNTLEAHKELDHAATEDHASKTFSWPHRQCQRPVPGTLRGVPAPLRPATRDM